MNSMHEPEPGKAEKEENKTERILLDKLGRFADYASPTMKELLFYGKGKLPNGAS